MDVRAWFQRRGGWLLAEVGWFSALTVALTWPMALNGQRALVGSVHADGMKHLWTLWWMKTSVLQEHRFPFHTQLINYPEGMDLYPIEPLNGLVAVLLPWMGIVGLANLLIFLNMLATGLAGAWFGRGVSGSRWGGLAAGTLLVGSEVMAFFVHVGVGELLHLWWLPLGLGVLERARRTGEWRWFLALAGCLVFSLISCFYLGFFLALATAVWALCTLWAGRRTPRLLLQYTVAAGLSIAIVLPVTRSFATSYRSGDVPPVGLRSYLLDNHGQPITDPPSARAELAHLVTPGRQAARREETAYGGGRYLGLLAVGMGLAGLVLRPRQGLPWLIVGGVGVVFALGSYLTAGGEAVLSSGRQIQMPVLWLNRLLGYYAEPLNFPVRFLAVTATALAALAALAVRRPWVALLAPLAVAEITWGALVPWPRETFSPRNAGALRPMREMENKAVLDLSLAMRSDQENRFNALSLQIEHGRRTNAVPIERVEYFARDGLYFAQATTFVQDLAPLYLYSSEALDGDYRPDFALLQDAGFGWVVVTHRSGDEELPPTLDRGLNQLLGQAVLRSRGLGVWALPQVEYTPEELEKWKAEHQWKMDQLRRLDPGMRGRQ